MTTLVIDSANYTMSVGLVDGENVIGEYVTHLPKNHSERVMVAIEQLMEACDLTPRDLTKIVVGNGPGSYTGVRIGLTIAKSLAWTLQIPIHSVSSLASIAASAAFFHGKIIPMIDARRDQVFAGIYEGNMNGKVQVAHEDCCILIQDLLTTCEQLDGPLLFVGPDVEKFKERITDALKNKHVYFHPAAAVARAGWMVTLADETNAQQAHEVVPEYKRITEAEANWKQANS